MGETGKRLISGLTLAGIFIFCFNYAGVYRVFLLIFTTIFAVIAMREFYKIAEGSIGEKIPSIPGILFGCYILILAYLTILNKRYVPGDPYFNQTIKNILNTIDLNYHVFTGSFIAFFLIVLLLRLLQNKVENSIYIVAIELMGVIYIPLTFLHLLLLQNLSDGIFYIWIIAWATGMSDTMAYFFGKAFGKHKVGFAVSPNKSWEGYIGGLFGQVAITNLFYFVAKTYFTVPQISILEMSIFAAIVYLASVLGDLAESLFKRDAKAKDSGSFIPGHGGALDLLDAMMVTLPAGYYYFYFLERLKASALF